MRWPTLARALRLLYETGQPPFPALLFAQTPPQVVLQVDSPSDSFARGRNREPLQSPTEELPASQISQITCRRSVLVTRLYQDFPKHPLSFHRNNGSFFPRGRAWHKQVWERRRLVSGAGRRWEQVWGAGVAEGGWGSAGARVLGRPVGAAIRSPPPPFLPGRRDSSGIRLYYTATLRRFDAGIMELGLVYTPVMAIPPQETSFVLTGYCTDKCTQLVSGAGPGTCRSLAPAPGRRSYGW